MHGVGEGSAGTLRGKETELYEAPADMQVMASVPETPPCGMRIPPFQMRRQAPTSEGQSNGPPPDHGPSRAQMVVSDPRA